MNFKTTGILFVLVAIVAVLIFALPEEKITAPEKPSANTAKVELEKLIDDDFGDTVRIEVSKADEPSWTFVKSEGESEDDAVWAMTSPYEFTVQKWQVETIASQLKKLEYTSKHDGSTGSVTAESCGLQPPHATITLTNADDKTVRVHVGRDEGSREAYVSLDDDPTIYRVNAALKSLLKDEALAYRDQKMFDVETGQIVRLEIREPNPDGGIDTYVMAKTGAEWRFEKPTPAKGLADQINKVCSTFAALRAQKWVAGNVSDMARYGLDDNARTIIATSAKLEVPKTDSDADSNGTPPEPKEVISEFVLHLSSVSPIGEDTKVYASRGDEKIVGTVAKNLADTFAPNLKEWRDNGFIERDTTTARSITLTHGGVTTLFERSGTDWRFAESQALADRVEIHSLLTAIKDLKAVNFIAGASVDDAEFGFNDPKGVVALKFDDDEDNLTLTIGSLTDSASKRLTYIRANDTIAKVNTTDIVKLLRSETVYRDSTVVAQPKERIQSITIERTAGALGGSEPAMSVTLTQTDDQWLMTAPVQSQVDELQLQRLLSMLSNLRAMSIVDLAEGDDRSKYGLDKPAVRFAYTITPPVAYRVLPDDVNSNGTNRVEKIQPPAETYELLIGQADGHVYVQPVDTPEYVYIIADTLLPDFLAEYRKKQIFSFEADDVSAVTMTDGDSTLGLSKEDGQWFYAQEPDVPLDQAKVANYVLRVKNAAINRVVQYGAPDVAVYGLDEPRYRLNVTLAAGELPALFISEKTDSQGNHFAASEGSSDVFTVPAETITQVAINVDEFAQGG
ncbi:MAG: DUF4340 domain-containing protein [Phycisphaerales bacterium]|nr:DUF4340 domain-containing protein [Phycisphaerales bacterium]